MYVSVNVEASRNCPMQLERVFETLGEPREVHGAVAPDPSGEDVWCHVTGWSSEGPCPAYGALVEDSGEGVLMLIYGGDEGIRLKPAVSEDDWDVNCPGQWGEACLLLDKDVDLS